MIHAFVWWVLSVILRFVLTFPTVVNDSGHTEIVIENSYLSDLILMLGLFSGGRAGAFVTQLF